MPIEVAIAESWKPILKQEFDSPYFEALRLFLKQEKAKGATIYPPGSQLFSAFEHTAFEDVKVVILGQDPYHGTGQAHGLCFSVNKGISVPPSLQNIYKELVTDIPGFTIPAHGDLSGWAKQGVLLLNATLTVEKDKAGSHQGKGWEQFTDAVIKQLSARKEHLVFILWGKFAQSKAPLIDAGKHLVLKAAHPSPFSAYNGFFGCKHFSGTNAYLTELGLPPINWQL
ncbi:MAG: uracil-DNA glycosylase [Bacteroidota bacterium]